MRYVRRRWLSAAAALALAAGTALVGAGPAPALPTVNITAPALGEVVGVKNPTLVADVSSVGGKLTGQITLILDWTEGTQDPANPPPVAAAGQPTQRVSFPLNLAYNGRYVAVVQATDDGALGGSGRNLDHEFFVAAPPAVPSGVKAAGVPPGKVTVSWNKNAEPDIVGYRVERIAGGGAAAPIGTTGETSFTDSAPPGGPGAYQVVALRRGARPGQEVASAPSPRAIVGGGAGKGGAPTALNKANLSKFEQLLADAKAQAAAAAAGGLGEDGGFDANLPYARSDDDEELGSDEPLAGGRRTLPFVAGALLVLDACLLLRVIRSQALRQPPAA